MLEVMAFKRNSASCVISGNVALTRWGSFFLYFATFEGHPREYSGRQILIRKLEVRPLASFKFSHSHLGQVI